MTTPSKNHETHAACENRLEKYGQDAHCCFCDPHEMCNLLEEAPPKKQCGHRQFIANCLENRDVVEEWYNSPTKIQAMFRVDYVTACSIKDAIHRVQREEHKVLELVHELLSSDAAFESDCVTMDVLKGRSVSKREIALAGLVTKLYKIVHPDFCDALHEDWERERDSLTKQEKE